MPLCELLWLQRKKKNWTVDKTEPQQLQLTTFILLKRDRKYGTCLIVKVGADWKECCEGSDISTTYLVKVRIVKWFCWWTQLSIYLDHPYKEDHNSQSILPGSCTLLLNRKTKIWPFFFMSWLVSYCEGN